MSLPETTLYYITERRILLQESCEFVMNRYDCNQFCGLYALINKVRTLLSIPVCTPCCTRDTIYGTPSATCTTPVPR